jgi:hypothetical protein
MHAFTVFVENVARFALTSNATHFGAHRRRRLVIAAREWTGGPAIGVLFIVAAFDRGDHHIVTPVFVRWTSVGQYYGPQMAARQWWLYDGHWTQALWHIWTWFEPAVELDVVTDHAFVTRCKGAWVFIVANRQLAAICQRHHLCQTSGPQWSIDSAALQLLWTRR